MPAPPPAPVSVASEEPWDAIIVGAGPAGCAAAYDLATAGRRVLLLDRRSFPRAKACACGLTRKTLKALRYAVDPVIERDCRNVVLQEAGPAFQAGGRVADKTLEIRIRTRAPFCATAVRSRFDAFCLEQTLAAGAHFRKIETIAALGETGSHAELDVLLAEGERQTLTARIVLGADGSNGQMRRLVEARHATQHGERETDGGEPAWYARGFALEATVPYDLLPESLPAGDAPLDLVFDFSPIAGGYGWLFPKGDHINVGVGGFVPQATGAAAAGTPGMQYESVTRALLAQYTRAKLGVELSALPAANVTGQHLGLGGHAYVPQGRFWLAGDAAGLVDPLTGEGIHSALVSGQAAASALLQTKGEASAETLAQAYAAALHPLQETLAFSHRAARSFYREPSRGFRVMRAPLLRSLVLKTYADGLPATRLLTRLAKAVV